MSAVGVVITKKMPEPGACNSTFVILESLNLTHAISTSGLWRLGCRTVTVGYGPVPHSRGARRGADD